MPTTNFRCAQLSTIICAFLLSSSPLLPANAGGTGGMGGGGRHGGGNSRNQYVPPDREPKVNPFAPDSPATLGIQARMDALEKFIFGKPTRKSLEIRATKLEKKLVPYEHNLASMDIEKRVDNLWNIMVKANVNASYEPKLNES